MYKRQDLQQCLPVQPRANRSELVDLSIKENSLWRHFNFFSLTENTRVNPEQRDFAEYLLKVGNGDLPVNAMHEIELPEDILSNGNLTEEVFRDCLAKNRYENTKDRAILEPIIKMLIKLMQKLLKSFLESAKFTTVMILSKINQKEVSNLLLNS